MENYAGFQPACPPPGSQESNFPKKLSKTKSAPYGSAVLPAPRAGQASAFRGRSGPLHATLRCGCGFPGAVPCSPGLPQPPKPPGSLPFPSRFSRPGRSCSIASAALAVETQWGKGIFSGRLVRDTSRGTWGARGCGSSRFPLLPLPHPTPGLPRAPAASGSSCKN